jgi:hypothetical protein
MVWTILGLSVGILAFFCIATAEFLAGNPIFEPFRPHLAIGLGVLGGVAWVTGRILAARKDEAAPRSFLLADLRYWGPMFLVLGLITVFIQPLRFSKTIKHSPPQKPAIVKVVPPPPKPPEPVAPVAKAPAVFPNLKVQGVLFGGSEPVAIVNGQSYMVGDHIGEVVVKAIERNGVMLEIAGEVKFLALN